MTEPADEQQGLLKTALDDGFARAVWLRIGTMEERRARRRRTGMAAAFLAVAMISGTSMAVGGDARTPAALWGASHDPATLLDVDG